MPIDYLAFVLRLLHILAAITAVGGAIFVRFALLPGMQSLSEDQCRRLHDVVRPRLARLVQISILFLLVSGLINYIMFVRAARQWSDEWREMYSMPYHMLFGIKFLLALAIFALSSILTGRSPGTQKIRDNSRFWLNVNLALALAVIMISGVMRLTHVGPTDPSEAAAAAKSGG
jgi:uncharacterized membrane protein